MIEDPGPVPIAGQYKWFSTDQYEIVIDDSEIEVLEVRIYRSGDMGGDSVGKLQLYKQPADIERAENKETKLYDQKEFLTW